MSLLHTSNGGHRGNNTTLLTINVAFVIVFKLKALNYLVKLNIVSPTSIIISTARNNNVLVANASCIVGATCGTLNVINDILTLVATNFN